MVFKLQNLLRQENPQTALQMFKDSQQEIVRLTLSCVNMVKKRAREQTPLSTTVAELVELTNELEMDAKKEAIKKGTK